MYPEDAATHLEGPRGLHQAELVAGWVAAWRRGGGVCVRVVSARVAGLCSCFVWRVLLYAT
ncbi:hypothetical protein E2C01_088376 [Portunus trituberculatus]|uniref:Uncharacterized protein n=1 Tax=Portunus trituberculatus TaxID=210409 RepID=A0A5B7JAK4_PORTR|nr:hypothetical protein [Portunus trituberculatus]